MTVPQLLIIDDDPAIAKFLAIAGDMCGFGSAVATRLAECETYFETRAPQVIILDLLMPEVDGVEMLRWLAKRGTQAGILLLSGLDMRVLQSTHALGVELRLNMLGALRKPIGFKELEPILQKAANRAAPPGEEAKQFPPAAGQRISPIGAQGLKEAIERRELVNYYQPQITFDNRICGLEALVRWQRPGEGIVPPAEFIPLAERSGLIGPLTWQVLESALHDIAVWSGHGWNRPVAINIAPVMLDDLQLPEKIVDCLDKYAIPPSRLKLEITESGAMKNEARSMDILSRLRMKGFALSMDDFGTGYSSLVQLHRLPFSELKIDQSFVRDVESRDESQIIVGLCIDLARKLGLTTCAEGVETEQALRLLAKYGCTSAQGYYISRPIPAQDVLGWASDWDAAHGTDRAAA